MKRTKTTLLAAVLFVVFSAAMVGLNVVTGPIIESNGAAAQFAPLLAVMPEAENFEQLYDAADAASYDLVDVPATVQSIYSEVNGLGYVLRMSTTEGYTGDAIELTMAVDAEGKISGIQVDAYPETKDFGAEYPTTYLGQDSTLAEVTLVGGVTYSSSAFKNAVIDGFTAMVNNSLVSAGVKGDAQILAELALREYTGLANSAGVGQYEEMEPTGSFTAIYKALNDSGFAYIVKDGDASVLVLVNAFGGARVLDVEGSDVTEAHAAAADEAKAHAAANLKSMTESDLKKLNKLLPDAEVTPLVLEGLFNSVTSAFEMKAGGQVYYGIAARTYAYSNIPTSNYYVLDANGAIVTFSAEELILHKEYFNAYTLDEPAYKAGFAGLTAETFTGEQALVSGATMTSDAVTTATNDAFAAFQAIRENGGVN